MGFLVTLRLLEVVGVDQVRLLIGQQALFTLLVVLAQFSLFATLSQAGLASSALALLAALRSFGVGRVSRREDPILGLVA